MHYIQNELDSLLESQTPRGSLTDKRGILRMSIEGIVRDAVDRGLMAQEFEYQKRFQEMHSRIETLEAKLGVDTPKPKNFFREKLRVRRGKSPTKKDSP